MAIYKTHVRFNLFVGLPLLLGGLWFFLHPEIKEVLLFSFCFIYATLFLNPDLDLSYKIKLFSLRGILTFPFRFYAMIFHHRGLSHHPLFGTLSRLMWAGGCYYLLLLCFFSLKSPHLSFVDYRQDLFYGLSAIFCADLCHLALD